MSSLENWNHEWFGVWMESGAAHEKCPSIRDFIDKQSPDYHDKDQLAKYLETAQVVATTSRLRFPCVLTGKKFVGSLSYRTNGKWLWPDDLAYYVREHHVRLPTKMVEAIRQSAYKTPVVSDETISNLERPPTTSQPRSNEQ
jgi:hypothetical protein